MRSFIFFTPIPRAPGPTLNTLMKLHVELVTNDANDKSLHNERPLNVSCDPALPRVFPHAGIWRPISLPGGTLPYVRGTEFPVYLFLAPVTISPACHPAYPASAAQALSAGHHLRQCLRESAAALQRTMRLTALLYWRPMCRGATSPQAGQLASQLEPHSAAHGERQSSAMRVAAFLDCECLPLGFISLVPAIPLRNRAVLTNPPVDGTEGNVCGVARVASRLRNGTDG